MNAPRITGLKGDKLDRNYVFSTSQEHSAPGLGQI